MSVTITTKPEMNVVNVGDELTTDQLAALQNAQGASATNPVLTRTNTFNTADAAVRITQEGTGEAFRVEDSTNPDSTPFVITATGWVGIGTASVANALTVSGRANITSSSGGGGDPALAVLNTGTGSVPALVAQVTASTSSSSNVALFSNHASATADCVRITNLGTGNSFVVEDDTNPDSSPFAITATGNVGIGTGIPTSKLQVQGGGVTFVNGSPSTNYFSLVTSHTGVGLGLSNGATNSSELISATAIGTGSIAVFTNTATATADAVRITNLGSGNSFVVEDSTNPDLSPFVITATGNVGIGVLAPAAHLEVNSGIVTRKNFICTHPSSLYTANLAEFTENGSGTAVTITSGSTATGDTLKIVNQGTGNSFVIEDEASDTTPFVIDNAGNVTLGGSLTLAAGAYAANAALVIDNTNYPHELEFKVGGVTYRVPARAI